MTEVGARQAREVADPEVVFAVVRAAVARVLELDPAQVRRDCRLAEDLGADSLALVEIAELVEETLRTLVATRFRFDDAELDELATVGDAVAYALARL